MRASECAAGDQNGDASNEGLRGADIAPKQGGEPCSSMGAANEVVIKIRASKADQFNRGEWRNHFKAQQEEQDGQGPVPLRAVEALAISESWALGGGVKGTRTHDPRFTFADGP